MESEKVQIKFITPTDVKAAMDSWFAESKHKPRNVMEKEWNELFGEQKYEKFDSYIHVQYAFIRLEILQRYTETAYRFSREALEKLIPEFQAALPLSFDKQGMIDGLVDPSKTWQQILKDMYKKNKK